MSKYVTVGKLGNLPPGECRVVEVHGTELALCNVDGTYYAIDNTCVHQGGPLGEGVMDGENIICPWHSWRYNVKTGASPSNPSVSVKTYPVKIDNGEVKVSLA